MSVKSVAAKLLIKTHSALWVSDPALQQRLGPLPNDVTIVAEPGQASIAVLVADNASTLRTNLAHYRDQLTQPPVLWVAYPKGNRTDINRDTLWPILADYALRPITQVAVDDTWSALRFRPLNEGEGHFGGGRRE